MKRTIALFLVFIGLFAAIEPAQAVCNGASSIQQNGCPNIPPPCKKGG